MPLASAMNTEFRELTAASAALTAAGNTQAVAVTQIRGALVALSKDTEARNLFESATGMSYSEFQAQGGTLQEAMKIIVDEAERMGVSLPQAFGRIEGATAALTLAGEGAETFARAMAETAGATEAAYQRMAETTDHRLNIIKAHWEQFKVGLGGIFTDIGTGFAGYVHDLQSIWGGKTLAEKEAMKVSEENWRKYATNVARTQAAHAQWARETLTRLPGMTGTGQATAVPGLDFRTQAGPGSVGEWIAGVSGMGGHGGDVWDLADMTERFKAIMLENVRDAYNVFDGGGGGGRVTKLTDSIDRLNATLEEELEEARRWQIRPADPAVLPEQLRASDPRFSSRRVANLLAGGRL